MKVNKKRNEIMNKFNEKYKVVICYKAYESIFEPNDSEHLCWEDYTSLEDFKKNYPDYEVIYVFNKSDSLKLC